MLRKGGGAGGRKPSAVMAARRPGAVHSVPASAGKVSTEKKKMQTVTRKSQPQQPRIQSGALRFVRLSLCRAERPAGLGPRGAGRCRPWGRERRRAAGRRWGPGPPSGHRAGAGGRASRAGKWPRLEGGWVSPDWRLLRALGVLVLAEQPRCPGGGTRRSGTIVRTGHLRCARTRAVRGNPPGSCLSHPCLCLL